ncbi:MAG: hypothetical protein WDN49_05725 [Acetobacteraceae bacterium]
MSTAPGRAGTWERGAILLKALRDETAAAGIRLFDIDQPGQGIVHVIGPELGISLRAPCWSAATATPARMAASARWASASAGRN